ncbi:MAG TPA: hypothetical protein VFG65_07090, partial [Fimbriimonadales bacterium]|nr:hypothetical protein [Fimbriimonadales bacterium]
KSGDLTVGAVTKIEQAFKGVGVGEETEFHLYDQLRGPEKWRDGKARLLVFHDRPTIVRSGPKLEVWPSAAVLGGDFSFMLHTDGFRAGGLARTGFCRGGIAGT